MATSSAEDMICTSDSAIFLQDGFICYKDFDAQMKYMLVSHKHTDETMAKITNLFEVAWERVRHEISLMGQRYTGYHSSSCSR